MEFVSRDAGRVRNGFDRGLLAPALGNKSDGAANKVIVAQCGVQRTGFGQTMVVDCKVHHAPDVGWRPRPNHPFPDFVGMILDHRIVGRTPPGGLERGDQGIGKACFFVRAQKTANGEAAAFRKQIELFHAKFGVGLAVELHP